MCIMISCFLGIGLCACTLFRGSPHTESRRGPEGGSVAVGEDIEAALREAVRKHIQAAGTNAGDSSPKDARLVYSRPFYFREYAVYPGGNQSIELDLRETDSVTEPYAADVRLEKVDFVTRPRRKRADAEADGDFFRRTGVETLTYKFKNGRWVNVGSLFEARKVEEYAGGQWIPVEEEVHQTVAVDEERRGILGRVWSSIFGR